MYYNGFALVTTRNAAVLPHHWARRTNVTQNCYTPVVRRRYCIEENCLSSRNCAVSNIPAGGQQSAYKDSLLSCYVAQKLFRPQIVGHERLRTTLLFEQIL